MIAGKPANIDEYIALFPKYIQEILEQVRIAVKTAAPGAEEKISYGMPAFTLHGSQLVYFAAFKNHIGFYALPQGNAAFQKELACYKTSKGSIQFPLDNKPMPLELIADIVKFRAQENMEKARLKALSKNKK